MIEQEPLGVRFPCIIPDDILTNPDKASQFIYDYGLKIYSYDYRIRETWIKVDQEVAMFIPRANWNGNYCYLTLGMVHAAFNMVDQYFFGTTFRNMCSFIKLKVTNKPNPGVLAMTIANFTTCKYE